MVCSFKQITCSHYNMLITRGGDDGCTQYNVMRKYSALALCRKHDIEDEDDILSKCGHFIVPKKKYLYMHYDCNPSIWLILRN